MKELNKTELIKAITTTVDITKMYIKDLEEGAETLNIYIQVDLYYNINRALNNAYKSIYGVSCDYREGVDKIANHIIDKRLNSLHNQLHDMQVVSVNEKKKEIKTTLERYSINRMFEQFGDVEIIKEFSNGNTLIKVKDFDAFMELYNFTNDTTEKYLKCIGDDTRKQFQENMRATYYNKYNIIHTLREQYNISMLEKPNYALIFKSLKQKVS